MKGGKIIVDGDVNEVGWLMEKGEVHIGGNLESVDEKIIGGNIFHKGVQIVKNGKLVK